ncbi:hypothetical protein CVT25_000919 [Psilocybe cyanescens]|uniref:DUF4100 domain-containing protein n=1 Tax=Psilocybe cyanescens TaxID=93625 RepID=A0A409WZA6_PSICY|nr:hypothetical protein CVT25_000919 [Psilocybe cyanescens]
MEDLELLESLIASTQKKVDETKKKMNASRPYTGLTTQNMTKSNSHNLAKALTPMGMSVPAVNSGTSPQYQYTMPIKDPKIVEKLLKCTLDAPVTLSSRELLAMAPDVCKQFRELVSTKRVTTGHLGSLTLEEGESVIGVESYLASLLAQTKELVIAKHSEELQAMDFKMGDLTVEGVMDEGSQICVLRRDIWEKLGLPLRSDHIMVMDSFEEIVSAVCARFVDSVYKA